MARFYKTARPQNIDYAFKLPTNLLAKVVQTKDAAIDKTFDELEKMELSLAKQKDSTSKIGQGMYLTPDEKANIERMKHHEDTINQISERLRENPMEYGTLQGDISSARADIRSDFLYGALAKQHENYAYVKEWHKAMDKAKISREYQNAVLQKSMSEWGGTNFNPETGSFNDIEKILPKSLIGETFEDKALFYGGKVKDRTSPRGIQENVVKQMMADQDIYKIYAEQSNYGYIPDEYKITASDTLEEKQAKIEGFARSEAATIGDLFYKPESETDSKKADYSKMRTTRVLTDTDGNTLNFEGAWPKNYNKSQQTSIKKDVANPELWKNATVYFEEGEKPFGDYTTPKEAKDAGIISFNPKDDRNIPAIKYAGLDEYIDRPAVDEYVRRIVAGESEEEAQKGFDKYQKEAITKWATMNPNFKIDDYEIGSDGNIKQKNSTYFKVDENTIKPGYDAATGKTVFTFEASIGGEPYVMGIDADEAVEIDNFAPMVADPDLRLGTKESDKLTSMFSEAEIGKPVQFEDDTLWIHKDKDGYYYGKTSTAKRESSAQTWTTAQALDRIKKRL